ncbi:MAG: hypothetical protein CMB64_01280 [Euryarchaeota archaeon]|nr:hypothetical protein [Euryarchaeota archaeon]|tara:strand:- start:2535 stop:2960 length:426 start_codon:yes stop_codon:yes gene_type:complete
MPSGETQQTITPPGLTILNENDKLKILFNFFLSFFLIHEILVCLFVGFSIKSIFIFLIITFFLPQIRTELDEDLIAIFSGIFLGIRGVGLTLSESWSTPFSTDTLDPIIRNWIMFLSAPILGILLFYLLRFILEKLNSKSN